MADLSKYCDISNAFNFQRDVQLPIGHVTKLKIGDKTFNADLTLTNPIDESDAKVIGALSSFAWEGGYAQPMQFAFNVSITNKNEFATLIHTEMKNIAVGIAWDIYQYDEEKKGFFKSLHTNDAAVKAIIEVTGADRNLYLDDEPGAEVQQPRNYQVTLGIVPEDEKQDIQVAVSTDQKFVKPWGVTRG